jgi:hypothetical protein
VNLERRQGKEKKMTRMWIKMFAYVQVSRTLILKVGFSTA